LKASTQRTYVRSAPGNLAPSRQPAARRPHAFRQPRRHGALAGGVGDEVVADLDHGVQQAPRQRLRCQRVRHAIPGPVGPVAVHHEARPRPRPPSHAFEQRVGEAPVAVVQDADAGLAADALEDRREAVHGDQRRRPPGGEARVEAARQRRRAVQQLSAARTRKHAFLAGTVFAPSFLRENPLFGFDQTFGHLAGRIIVEVGTKSLGHGSTSRLNA
jgi:hypothetical protein